VYWTRRLILVAVALLLIVTIARVLGGGSDGKGTGGDQARQAAAEVQNPAKSGPSDDAKDSAASTSPAAGKPTGSNAPLAVPSGPCKPEDVKVTPVIERAPGGRAVPIGLAITSGVPACTFSVSSKSVVLKVTSGPDGIWSSQQCPGAITPSDVVARAAVPAQVVVNWDGRRSDEDCSRSAGWANVGWYHAIAATLGGEPTDTQFELTRPPAVVVTVTPKPRPATTVTPTP
jgi:hypothetical protein